MKVVVVVLNGSEMTQTDVIHDFWFMLPEGLLELEGHQHTKYDSGKRVPLTHISMLFQSFLSQGVSLTRYLDFIWCQDYLFRIQMEEPNTWRALIVQPR